MGARLHRRAKPERAGDRAARIPDVISWLDEIHGLLVAGGILSLVVPDKRFTFDVNRLPSDVSTILDAHHQKLVRPTFGQIYDFLSRSIPGVDAGKIWSGEQDYCDLVRTDWLDPDLTAFELAHEFLASGEFVDIHCHVFTPASFLAIIDRLGHLGLLKYELASFHPTPRNDLEFFASFRALDMASPDVRDRQRRTVAAAVASLRDAELPATELAAENVVGEPPGAQLSDLERRLIGIKRTAMSQLRRTARISKAHAE